MIGVGELLVEEIKLGSKTMIQAIKDGDTHTSSLHLERIRWVSCFGDKLIEHGYLEEDFLEDDLLWNKLEKIADSVYQIGKSDYADKAIAEAAFIDIQALIGSIELNILASA